MSEVKRLHVELESFITAWETSNSVSEVAQKLGIKETSILARASKCRTVLNLPLKKMTKTGGGRLDLDGARALIAKLNTPKVEETAPPTEEPAPTA